MKMPLLCKDAPACCLLDENSMFLPRQNYVSLPESRASPTLSDAFRRKC